MSNLPVLRHVVEGEFLGDVTVSPEGMAKMNEARASFRELESILMTQVLPGLVREGSPLAVEIESRIEMVIFRSQNFLWPHRHAGAAHNAVNVGGAA